MFTSTLAFLVFKAAAVFEYAICFYFCITRPIALAGYFLYWLQMPKINIFFGNCEQFVEKSKLNPQKHLISSKTYMHNSFIMFVYFHSKTGMERESISSTTIYNQVVIQMQRFSKLTHFILMKVTLAVFMVPTIIATYLKYYAFGLGDASFSDLPLMYEMK